MTAGRSERNKAGGGRLESVFGTLLVRRFTVRQPEMYRVVEAVTAERLTSLSPAALCELAQTAMDLDYDDTEGDFLQAGCSLGGAAIVMAHAKRRARALTVHDPFDSPDSQERARKELAAHGADERLNVRLVPGPYEATVAADGPLALAHLDCGEYAAMRVLLERVSPRLAAGGQLVIDDYKTREECRQAVDDHFRGKKGFRIERKSRLHVVRN